MCSGVGGLRNTMLSANIRFQKRGILCDSIYVKFEEKRKTYSVVLSPQRRGVGETRRGTGSASHCGQSCLFG